MTSPVPSKPTAAFFLQSAVSFGVAVVGLGIGIAYLPVNQWMRAFLTIGLLYTVTSAFTLAKCVRDHQDSATVVQRVDQARLDKLLTDHDPFRVPGQ